MDGVHGSLGLFHQGVDSYYSSRTYSKHKLYFRFLWFDLSFISVLRVLYLTSLSLHARGSFSFAIICLWSCIASKTSGPWSLECVGSSKVVPWSYWIPSCYFRRDSLFLGHMLSAYSKHLATGIDWPLLLRKKCWSWEVLLASPGLLRPTVSKTLFSLLSF